VKLLGQHVIECDTRVRQPGRGSGSPRWWLRAQPRFAVRSASACSIELTCFSHDADRLHLGRMDVGVPLWAVFVLNTICRPAIQQSGQLDGVQRGAGPGDGSIAPVDGATLQRHGRSSASSCPAKWRASRGVGAAVAVVDGATLATA